MSISREVLSGLVLQEAKLCFSINRRSRVHCRGKLLCPIIMDEANFDDYGVKYDKVPLLCDNESAIKIAHNPVQHSRTNHIDIRHHFLRDHVQREDIVISHVRTEDQLADIFTKALDEKRFCALRFELNILDSRNVQ